MKDFSKHFNDSSSRSLIAVFVIQIILLLLLAVIYFIGSTEIFDISVGDFWFAVIMGSLGASIALMRRFNSEEAPRDGNIILTTVMPILYGMIMASIAYLLFISKIVSGDNGGGLFSTNLFPNFIYLDEGAGQQDTIFTRWRMIHVAGIQDLGKLLIWCFITGYSENFITGILRNLESRARVEES